jgi:general L-amino acid transport system permease protein
VVDALIVGAKNTITVSVLGIALATVLGVVVGIARLSTNWIVRRVASLYVESLRNIPVLVIIVFWSAAVILTLPRIEDSIEWLDAIVLSNRGLWVPTVVGRDGVGAFWIALAAAGVGALALAWWRTRRFEVTGRPHHRLLWAIGVIVGVAAVVYVALEQPLVVSLPERTARSVAGGRVVSPEFTALLVGLVVYTASHIAEIVRGSIQAVPRGQTEAATAVGLSPFQRLRYVVLPQAFRIAIPPMSNQFLNLTKNSSLAIVIGYPELMRVTRIAIGNGSPAPQSLALLMVVYLALSLTISAAANLANRRLQLAGLR